MLVQNQSPFETQSKSRGFHHPLLTAFLFTVLTGVLFYNFYIKKNDSYEESKVN